MEVESRMVVTRGWEGGMGKGLSVFAKLQLEVRGSGVPLHNRVAIYNNYVLSLYITQNAGRKEF